MEAKYEILVCIESFPKESSSKQIIKKKLDVFKAGGKEQIHINVKQISQICLRSEGRRAGKGGSG